MLHLETGSAEEILAVAHNQFQSRFVIVTSFQKEGMVLVDMAARLFQGVRVATLDTGRLPAETYGIMESVRERYGIAVEIFAPDSSELAAMVNAHGPNLFYNTVDLRRLCCFTRKIRPMDRLLETASAYATGLRREQSEDRGGIAKVERSNERWKLNPLADWSAAEIGAYTKAHNVPVHPLYAKGYTSIGCAPCTRAVRPGESERAGRWWWEDSAKKECGLHFEVAMDKLQDKIE